VFCLRPITTIESEAIMFHQAKCLRILLAGLSHDELLSVLAHVMVRWLHNVAELSDVSRWRQ
jgi:hypothetical protein